MNTHYSVSRGERKFVNKAVSSVLAEIQEYISNTHRMVLEKLDCSMLGTQAKSLSSKEKWIRFTSNKNLSTETIISSISDNVLASNLSQGEGDLDRSYSYSKQSSASSVKKACSGAIKSTKSYTNVRLPFKIESFFSFGRQGANFTPSIEVILLSLIYIDRFIRAQWVNDLGAGQYFDISR